MKKFIITGWSQKFDGFCVVAEGQDEVSAINKCEYFEGMKLVGIDGEGLFLFPARDGHRTMEDLRQTLKEWFDNGDGPRRCWQIFTSELQMGNNPDAVCW